MRFSAEIWTKICLKMRIFLKKAVKSPQRQEICPKTPRWPPALEIPPQDFRVVTLPFWYKFVEVRSSVLNLFHYLEKETVNSKSNAFASSALLRLFFTSNSAVFVGESAKIVLSSGVDTLAKPLITLWMPL